MLRYRTLTAVLLSCLITSALAAQGRGYSAKPDDPKGRVRAYHDWFGTVTPEYLAFKGTAAKREVARWPGTFPQPRALLDSLGPQAPTAGPQAPIAGPQAATTGPLTWVNLGPTSDALAGRDVDAGRLTGIVALPGNVLLVATSGGGVFRCANADPAGTADWVWTPVTDALPATSSTGNVSVGALALSLDGATLFLGLGDPVDALGKGFYRSTDSGTTWVESTVAGAATRTFCIRPVTAGIVLLGTNDGLKRSTDGGATFTVVTGALSTGEVWSVQRLSSVDVIASRKDANGTGTLYWSGDAGATWTLASLGQAITGLATGSLVLGRMSLQTSAASSTQAWGLVEVWDPAVGTPDKLAQGLLATSDRGHTWTFVAPANPTLPGTLFKGTGQQMSGDGGQAWYNQLIAVSPTDINKVLVGANLATYVTLDGGHTWAQATEWTGTGHPYAHADNQTHAWAPAGTVLYVGNDGGLAVYKDPWRAVPPTGDDATYLDHGRNKGIASQLTYNLGSTTATNTPDGRYRISLGCQDLGTRIRQGSGAALATSGDFTDQIGGDGFATLIHPKDANQFLASVYYTEVMRSTDGGQNFTDAISGITEALSATKAPFVTRLAVGWGDPTGNTVYTFTNGVVYKSLNFAGTWTALGTTGLPPAGTNATTDPTTALYIRQLGAARSNPQVVGIVANQGRVYTTLNGGATWTQGGSLPNNGLSTSAISFDATSASTFYVSSVAPDFTKSHLWKTTNGGASFASIDGSATVSNGLPWGIPVNTVMADPTQANLVYAGTDFGVYQSADGGATWSRLGTGLPLVAVRDLYVAPDGTFLRVATFGRGVWEATLSGTALPVVTFAAGGATQLAPGASATYAATVTGFTANSQVAWSDGGAGGSFNPALTASGAATVYTAPATPKTVTLTAASAENPAATAALTVQVFQPTAVTVAVSPATHVMEGLDSATFTANVTGAPGTGVTWTVTGGSVTAGGVFSAPAQPLGTQTYLITATSPFGASGTAQVTVKSLDLDASGAVGLEDLALLAYALGTAKPAAKLTDGATVSDADLAIFLARF